MRIYHVGRSGAAYFLRLVSDDFLALLTGLLEREALPPGRYWIQEAPRQAGAAARDWGIIEVGTNGRWRIRGDRIVLGPGYAILAP